MPPLPIPERQRRFEWPTYMLIVCIYGSWLGLVWWRLPGWIEVPALAVLLAWYSSLQHELIHGHPSRSAAFNRLLGLAPLAVWYPYDIYRRSHLAHHQEAHLTYPGIDPESNYLAPAAFHQLPPWLRPFYNATRTASGRMLVGPAFAILASVREAWVSLRTSSEVGIWLQHLGLLSLLALVLFMAGGPGLILRYGLAAYLALSLSMLRSFYEHRPAAVAAHRVVINEAGWFWCLLFLNNNLHLVHHEQPRLAWYRIPAAYRADRAGFLQRNGGFFVPGYGHLLRRYALRPIDAASYPGVRVSV